MTIGRTPLEIMRACVHDEPRVGAMVDRVTGEIIRACFSCGNDALLAQLDAVRERNQGEPEP